jgi:hypothetical protein
VAVAVTVTVSLTVSFSVTVTRCVTVADAAAAPASELALLLLASAAPFTRPGVAAPVSDAAGAAPSPSLLLVEVEDAAVVVVSSMGMTSSLVRVVAISVEVSRVVGPRTVVTTMGRSELREEGKVNSGSSCEVATAPSDAEPVADGSMVRVMVAVLVPKVRVAVRVMGFGRRVAEVGSELSSELVSEVDSRLVAELVAELVTELVAELEDRTEDAEAPGSRSSVEDDSEALEARPDDAEPVTVGSTITVVVPVGLDTVTTSVLVLRPVWLPAEEELDSKEEPLPTADEVALAEDEPVDSEVDEAGSMASGIVPKISFAAATSVQPTTDPSVVSMGRAKQAALGARQGKILKPSLPVHLASPPATHATWPSVQADCSVKVAKMSL